MNERQRVELDPGFEVEIPGDWSAEKDEEGGVLIAGPNAVGLLHLVSFPQADGEMLDPAEELYAFLEEHEIELQEDEVEDVELGEAAEMSLCEYVAEDEQEEGDDADDSASFWLIAVATAPGNLVFGSYSCPAGEEERERAAVRAILETLRPREIV